MVERDHIVIVGGGVIGISTAIALLDHPVSPCDVTIVAADLPPLDSKAYSPKAISGSSSPPPSYASAWAGAHHVSDASTPRQLERDKITFQVLQKIEEAIVKGGAAPWARDPGRRPVFWVDQTEYWSNGAGCIKTSVEWYPGYKILSTSDLPLKVDFGCTFSTFDIVVPNYLSLLFSYMLSLGGRAIKQKVGRIDEAIGLATGPQHNSTIVQGHSQPTAPPKLVIAAPGLGAKELLQDLGVHPVRGQTLLLRAPWCASTKPNEASSDAVFWRGMSRVTAEQGGYRDTYVIPRGDGTIIVGGTRLPNDFDEDPRSETTEEILKRVLPLMPTLKNPEKKNVDGKFSDQVDILAVNVGLRPARQGGIRIERANEHDEATFSRSLPMIYTYGFGGIGYQSSWGAAFEARRLVDEALNKNPAPLHSTISQLDAGCVHFPDPLTFM